MINSILIKSKSTELNIPFGNLLAGAATEQVLEFVTTWDKAKELWLINRSEIGLASYRNMIRDKLCFVCSENAVFSKISADAKDLKLHIINKAAEKDLVADVSLEDYGMKVILIADDLRSVVNIFIEKNAAKNVWPETDSLQTILENNKSLQLYLYPSEQAIAFHLTEILSKLELINDMNHYYQVYKMLTSQSVNGRKVRECLLNNCTENGIKIDDKPIKLLSYYRDYSYMAKKWKVQSRHKKQSEIAWTDIVDCLLEFLRPIWASLESGTMFLGDWMPQLRRFLD